MGWATPSRGRAAALLLLAAACARPGEPARGVLHLAPRLVDGRAPAAVLAARQRDVERREVGADARSLAPWRIARGALEARDGRAVLVGRARLEYPVPIDAALVDVVELAFGPRETARARLTWRGEAGEGELEQRAAPGHLVRFELARRATWAGRVEELALELDGPGGELQLASVALAAGGYRMGHEPGADDGGLVDLAREARRAWPADLGAPLVARAAVPRGGRLVVALAPAGAGLLPPDGADCAVEGRRADGAEASPWRRLAALRLAADELTWRRLSVDLSDFAGGEAELRLVAAEVGDLGAPGGGAPREPERARVLWGEPLVIGEPPADRRPNIVVATLDTVRADAMGAWTPTFDRLARDGVRFTDAWSACNATTPSHASMLTGLHVQDHGAWGNRDLLPAENVTLAELLAEAGWQTAAAVSVEHLQAGTGLGQGFDRFLQAHPTSHLDGRPTVDGVLGWIAEWRSQGERPFFLWVHLFDAHTPYGPPAPFLERFAARERAAVPPPTAEPPTVPPPITGPRAPEWLRGLSNVEHVRFLYRAGVAYADALLGEVVTGVERAGLDPDTLWIVTSDHGESLGEHSIWFEHRGLFRESLHVPLALRPPRSLDLPRGVVSDARVSTLDLFPTVARVAGIRPPAELRGVDLLGALARPDEHRRLWFEHSRLFQVATSDGREHFVATVRDGLDYGPELAPDGSIVWHRAEQGTAHLLDDAPGARDRAAEEPERVAELLRLVDEWRQSLLERQRTPRDVSSAEEAELRKMGYTGE